MSNLYTNGNAVSNEIIQSLPEGIILLDYIDTDGQSYIDTNYSQQITY